MATYTLQSKVEMSFIDHSREFSKTQFYVPALLADGSNRAAVLTAVQNMHAALAAATLCNLGAGSVQLYKIAEVPTTPADENAQREQGLWVQYVDVTTGKLYSLTIPGADRTLFAQINTDEVDISANVAAIALLDVIEANMKSEFGNAVQVTRMRLIGKSS
jgi:hypothetical protein